MTSFAICLASMFCSQSYSTPLFYDSEHVAIVTLCHLGEFAQMLKSCEDEGGHG